MKKKYKVELSAEDRAKLEAISKKGKGGARQIKRAHILLSASEGKTDDEIAGEVRSCRATVANIRKKYYEGGLEQALKERQRKGRPEKLQGKEKAHLIALACSEPPDGRAVWTMHLLANKCIELKLVDVICDETVRLILKKMKLSHGKLKVGVSRK